MKTALWIIAICEAIRAVQNLFQLRMLKKDTGARNNALAEFDKSLEKIDKGNPNLNEVIWDANGITFRYAHAIAERSEDAQKAD